MVMEVDCFEDRDLYLSMQKRQTSNTATLHTAWASVSHFVSIEWICFQPQSLGPAALTSYEGIGFRPLGGTRSLSCFCSEWLAGFRTWDGQARAPAWIGSEGDQFGLQSGLALLGPQPPLKHSTWATCTPATLVSQFLSSCLHPSQACAVLCI